MSSVPTTVYVGLRSGEIARAVAAGNTAAAAAVCVRVTGDGFPLLAGYLRDTLPTSTTSTPMPRR